jgi:hypothetical protein
MKPRCMLVPWIPAQPRRREAQCRQAAWHRFWGRCCIAIVQSICNCAHDFLGVRRVLHREPDDILKVSSFVLLIDRP